jgi:hypothetical protein
MKWLYVEKEHKINILELISGQNQCHFSTTQAKQANITSSFMCDFLKFILQNC